MATECKSQQGDGKYSLKFETDKKERYALVEKVAHMAVDGKTTADVVEVTKIEKDINFAIQATNLKSDYDIGLRNGLRLALAFIDGKEPQYESCKESKHKNPDDDENCVICNSELDEKYAGGIWDLAGEICSVLNLDGEHDEQDTIYNIIRDYIEQQEYCPRCGAKMKERI